MVALYNILMTIDHFFPDSSFIAVNNWNSVTQYFYEAIYPGQMLAFRLMMTNRLSLVVHNNRIECSYQGVIVKQNQINVQLHNLGPKRNHSSQKIKMRTSNQRESSNPRGEGFLL